jgi:hypothetical protein
MRLNAPVRSANDNNYYHYEKNKRKFFITSWSRGYIALVSLLKKSIRGNHACIGRQKMVWDNIYGGRALGVAAVVMAGGAGVLMNDGAE